MVVLCFRPKLLQYSYLWLEIAAKNVGARVVRFPHAEEEKDRVKIYPSADDNGYTTFHLHPTTEPYRLVVPQPERAPQKATLSAPAPINLGDVRSTATTPANRAKGVTGEPLMGLGTTSSSVSIGGGKGGRGGGGMSISSNMSVGSGGGQTPRPRGRRPRKEGEEEGDDISLDLRSGNGEVDDSNGLNLDPMDYDRAPGKGGGRAGHGEAEKATSELIPVGRRREETREDAPPAPAEPKRIMAKWTDEEKQTCIEAMGQLGKNWGEIAKYMGHTKRPEQIKNFYQNYKKRYSLDEKLPGGPPPSRRGGGAAAAEKAAAVLAEKEKMEKEERREREEKKEKERLAMEKERERERLAKEERREKENREREREREREKERLAHAQPPPPPTTAEKMPSASSALVAAAAAAMEREAASRSFSEPPMPPRPQSPKKSTSADRLQAETQDLTVVAAAVLAQLAGGGKPQQQQQQSQPPQPQQSSLHNPNLRHFPPNDYLDGPSLAAIAAQSASALPTSKGSMYAPHLAPPSTASAPHAYRFAGLPYTHYPQNPQHPPSFYGMQQGGGGQAHPLSHALLRGFPGGGPPQRGPTGNSGGGGQMADLYRGAYDTHPASLLNAEALNYPGMAPRKGKEEVRG